MRFITVPYSITYLGYKSNYKLDLNKIWKNQTISNELNSFMKVLMVAMDNFLKTKSPESLIEMWARKESCWELVKLQDFNIDFSTIKADMIDKNNPVKRVLISTDELEKIQNNENLEKIKAVPPEIWHSIEEWGRTTQNLSANLQKIAYTISGKIRSSLRITESEITNGIRILETLIEKKSELLLEIENFKAKEAMQIDNVEISIVLIKKMVSWDKRNKRLKEIEYKLLDDILAGEKPLSAINIKYVKLN